MNLEIFFCVVACLSDRLDGVSLHILEDGSLVKDNLMIWSRHPFGRLSAIAIRLLEHKPSWELLRKGWPDWLWDYGTSQAGKRAWSNTKLQQIVIRVSYPHCISDLLQECVHFECSI